MMLRGSSFPHRLTEVFRTGVDWLEEILIACPQCGEQFAIQVETAVAGSVEMIEDCAVCCRPALVLVTTSAGEVRDVRVEAA